MILSLKQILFTKTPFLRASCYLHFLYPSALQSAPQSPPVQEDTYAHENLRPQLEGEHLPHLEIRVEPHDLVQVVRGTNRGPEHASHLEEGVAEGRESLVSGSEKIDGSFA